MSAVLQEAPVVTETRWPDSPYKGLNYYTLRDSPLFCERDEEIDSCGRLAVHFATKMLLIHGRTGTGKSSFLRAGLFPRMFLSHGNFRCLREATGELCLIRSTADPLARIRDTLCARLREGGELGDLPAKACTEALERLAFGDHANADERQERVESALRTITANLRGTLVLAIDQAEEVFTLSTEATSPERDAYFRFLEQLCYTEFDIKVLLALRTEYYGQFADNFRFGPHLSVSTVRTGLEQFMLHGIQDPERVAKAILRPTLAEPVNGMSPPRDVYRFCYEPGLAEHIASDVVEHCGESSTLPVVQIVCTDLYESLVRSGVTREITTAMYRARGGVEGAIDRYIENSIRRSVLNATHRPPCDADIDAWQEVLSSLVARQEGGALTSLLVPESALVDFARRHRLGPHAQACLRAMADDKVRLLRSTNVRDSRFDDLSLHYSLGHDSLAPSLFQSKEARGKVGRLRRHFRFYQIGAAVALVAVVGFLFFAKVEAERMRVQSVLSYVDVEPQTRVRLLALAGLLRHPTLYTRPFVSLAPVQKKLRETLQLGPLWAFDTTAAGVSPDGRALAMVRGRKLVVRTLGDEQTPGEQPDREVAPPPIAVPFAFAVGFVSGLASPVIYNASSPRDATLAYWQNGKLIEENIGELNAAAEDAPVQPFAEIVGGGVRLTAFDARNRRLLFYDLAFTPDDGKFKARWSGATQVSSGLVWPVFADASDRFAMLVPAQNDVKDRVLIGSRADPSKAREVYAVKDPGNVDERLFVKQMTFVGADDTLLLRYAPRHFVLLQHEQQAIQLNVPNATDAMRLAAVRPQWSLSRPVLAAARTDHGLAVAWLNERGIVVLDQTAGSNELASRRPLLLASLPSLDAFSRLRFSDDGRFLTLVQQSGSGAAVRVWDVSAQRSAKIDAMSRDELLAEVCGVTRNDPGGARLSDYELRAHPDLFDVQPCGQP